MVSARAPLLPVFSRRDIVQAKPLQSDDDDNSFGLLNTSFDTMSEPDDAFGIGRDDAMFSPSSSAKEDDNLTPTKTSQPNADDLSMGNLSPIKLVYNSDTSSCSAQARSHEIASVVPLDWRSGEQQHEQRPGGSLTSPSPIVVLTTVRPYLLCMKYLLPCLRASGLVSPGPNAATRQNHEVRTTKIGPIERY